MLAKRAVISPAVFLFPILGPARLRGAAQRLAAFPRTDIAPAGGAEAKRKPSNWRRRQLFGGNVHKFQRHIEDDFRWQTCLAHDLPQPFTASGTKCASEIGTEFEKRCVRLY